MARLTTITSGIEDVNTSVKKPTSSYLAGSTSPNLGITKPVAQKKPASKPAIVNKTASTVNNAISAVADTSAYDRAWGQANAQYELQASQATQSNDLAMRQLTEQETERKGQTERLAQQAYIARKQSERVLPNVMGAMGTSGTGYENVAKQNIETSYENQYSSYMNELNLALASIKRAREGQSLNFNQNMESINLNKAQTYDDYQFNVAQAQKQAQERAIAQQQANVKKAQSEAYKKSEIEMNPKNFSSVVINALEYGTPDRATEYLQGAINRGIITKVQAEDIYTNYQNYWWEYNKQ